MSDSRNALLGILAGTAIGATLGSLFALDKGIYTRRKLIEDAEAAKESIAGTAIDFREKAATIISAQRNTLEDKLQSVVSDVSYKTEYN